MNCFSSSVVALTAAFVLVASVDGLSCKRDSDCQGAIEGSTCLDGFCQMVMDCTDEESLRCAPSAECIVKEWEAGFSTVCRCPDDYFGNPYKSCLKDGSCCSSN